MSIRTATGPVALVVDATEPTFRSGLAADLSTFAALSVRSIPVVTAIADRVTVHHEVPLAAVRAQLERLGDWPSPQAAKVGLLTSVAVIRLVAETLRRRHLPVVLDPVMVTRSGTRILRAPSVAALVRELLPLADLLTPNVVEASALAGFPIRSEADAKSAARAIQALGVRAVLITGGRADGDVVVDGLLDGRMWHRYARQRLDVADAHGIGSTLSSAVAAFLARGENVPDAVSAALAHAQEELAHAASR